MSQNDAHILEQMRDAKLDEYLEQNGGADGYDTCFEKVDNECAELCQDIIEIVKKYSSKFKVDELTILRDMIYPTLEAGVTA